MPIVRPFRAIHYAGGADLTKVTAPPYDVISESERRALHEAHPNNIIRITLGGDFSGEEGGDDKYDRAAECLRQWLDEGILRLDHAENYYLYTTEYDTGSGVSTTAGLVAALSLEPFGAGKVFPHERTIAGPIKDRLKLMRSTQANLEPLWFFASETLPGFKDLVQSTIALPPMGEASDPQGVTHKVWKVAPHEAAPLVDALEAVPLVIADGHHRYETAVTYRGERRAVDGPGPWDATLAMIVDPVHYPPTVLPIHRLAEGLSTDSLQNLLPFSGDLRALETFVLEAGPGTIGVATAAKRWTMSSPGPLDTQFLADTIVEPSGAHVVFEHDLDEVAGALDAGNRAAFLMAPVPIGLVADMALSGRRMPPKTTLFWPKPRTGLVMRDLT